MKNYYEDKNGYCVLLSEIVAISRVENFVILKNNFRLNFSTPTAIKELDNLIIAFKEYNEYNYNMQIKTAENNARFVDSAERLAGGK